MEGQEGDCHRPDGAVWSDVCTVNRQIVITSHTKNPANAGRILITKFDTHYYGPYDNHDKYYTQSGRSMPQVDSSAASGCEVLFGKGLDLINRHQANPFPNEHFSCDADFLLHANDGAIGGLQPDVCG
jgi:hypothetical protein